MADIKNNKEEKKKEEAVGYKFMQEKVTHPKRRKVKKYFLITVYVLVMAVVFGFVSRLIFEYSKGAAEKILNAKEDEGQDNTTTVSSSITPTVPAQQVATTESTTEKKEVETRTVSSTQTTSESSTSEVAKSEAASTAESEITTVSTSYDYMDREQTNTSTVSTDMSKTGEQSVDMLVDAYMGLRRVASKASSSLVSVMAVTDGEDWLGGEYEDEIETTGVFIGEKKYEKTTGMLVLVSLSKIQNANSIYVSIGDERLLSQLWAYDQDLDIAMIYAEVPLVYTIELADYKTDLKSVENNTEDDLLEGYSSFVREYASLSPADIETGKDSIGVGMPVIILGNPYGYMDTMQLCMIVGKSGYKYVTDNAVQLFYTDAITTLEGDGVAVNTAGSIVGFVSHIAEEEGSSVCCTLLSAESIKDILAKLKGKEREIYFGVIAEDMPKSVLSSKNLDAGIFVSEVVTASPAFEGGVKAGDIITEISGEKVTSVKKLHQILDSCKKGDEVSVTVHRVVRTNESDEMLRVILSER